MNSFHNGSFEVTLQKENFKFTAAHFVAFKGFRERLHGHNYRLGVKLLGTRIRHDGYLIDFGVVKDAARKCCKKLNEHVLIPTLSNVLDIVYNEDNIEVTYAEDGSRFVFPKGDCAFLPIVHSTVEEISVHFWNSIIDEIGLEYIRGRGISCIEITVSEDLNQSALFRHEIPDTGGTFSPLSVTTFLDSSEFTPQPCQPCNDSMPVSVSKASNSDLNLYVDEITKRIQELRACVCCQQVGSSNLSDKFDEIAKSIEKIKNR